MTTGFRFVPHANEDLAPLVNPPEEKERGAPDAHTKKKKCNVLHLTHLRPPAKFYTCTL